MRRVLRSVRAGIRLGRADRARLHALDHAYYGGASRTDYAGDAHNLRGLFAWEAALAGRFLPSTGHLLVLSAGGGREVLAYTRMGYAVDAYECHPDLRATANRLLGGPSVQPIARDVAPDPGPVAYDAIVLGWSAYSLVAGRAQRIALLASLRACAMPDGPLLLSFFTRERSPFDHRVLTAVGNALRRAEPVEDGDALMTNFVHFFTADEVAAELCAAGWSQLAYDPRGSAVAAA